MTLRTFAFLATLVFTVALFVACGGSGGEPTDSPSGTVTVTSTSLVTATPDVPST